MDIPEQLEVYYDEQKPPVRCMSVGEVRETLLRLHGQCDPAAPICACIQIPQYEICIGLGSDPTFVNLNVEPYDGQFYMSLGDADAPGCKDFYGCGNSTPFDVRNFVPFDSALAAVCEFVAHQRRSDRIAWEDWDQKRLWRSGPAV